MRILTLDIETITPDWTPPEDDPGKFPPLAFHEPCVVCWMIYDFSNQGYSFELDGCDTSSAKEAMILESLAADLKKADRLVTFNGRGFDMPILAHRASVLGIDWGFWYEPQPDRNNERRARFPHWKDDGFPWHFDILDQKGDYGAARGWKLTDVARSYGLPGKVGCDGSDVGKLWAAGLHKSIMRYCAHDVFLTWMCFVRQWASCADPSFAQLWEPSIEWARTVPELAPFYPKGVANAA